MTRRITVVGAGLAGSLLAAHLARGGHQVVALESRPDLRSTDIAAGRSINLALAQRGISALEQIGVMNEVRPLLIPMKGRMVHDGNEDPTFQQYGNRPDEVIYSVSRSGLNAVLLDSAEDSGAEIRFSHRCLGGAVADRTLTVQDDVAERQYLQEFDVVFGTDGVSSPVRDMLVESGTTTMSVEMLDHGYKEISLPPRASDGDFALDPHALHIWPHGGFMLIALPNLDRSFTCTLFLARHGESPSFATLESDAEVDRFFLARFPDFVDLVPDLADQFALNPIGHLGTVRADGWHAGAHASILGDAAHAIVPFHGQGMNAAFESVSLLVAELSRHDNWAHAFAEFEAIRKPDTDAIADMALDNYIEMRSSVAEEGYVLRRQLALELERRFPDAFVPRYSMVMFTDLPYAEVQRRAAAQALILDDLTDGLDSVDQVDFARAAERIGSLRQ